MPGKPENMDPERKTRCWEEYHYILKMFDDGMLKNACWNLLEDMWGAGGHLHELYESVYALKEKALQTDNELREKVLELTARVEQLESSNIRPLSCKNNYEA